MGSATTEVCPVSWAGGVRKLPGRCELEAEMRKVELEDVPGRGSSMCQDLKAAVMKPGVGDMMIFGDSRRQWDVLGDKLGGLHRKPLEKVGNERE